MSDEETISRWRKIWAATERELAAITPREIEAMTDEDVRRYVRLLYTHRYPDGPPKTVSGLVEQQRYFMKAHKRG